MGYSEQFAAFREARKLTREELSSLAGCHRNTVIHIETGRPVKFGTILRLMGKMGYTADSDETKLLAVLWLEAVSGMRLAPSDAKRLSKKWKREHSENDLREVTAAIAGLSKEDFAAVRIAVTRPGFLKVLKAIQELLPGSQ